MKLVTPNYSKRSPIVNDDHFVDGNPPVPSPTLASANTTFNPGQASSAFPSGPPRFIQAPGKRVYAKGETNKRIPGNI